MCGAVVGKMSLDVIEHLLDQKCDKFNVPRKNYVEENVVHLQGLSACLLDVRHHL